MKNDDIRKMAFRMLIHDETDQQAKAIFEQPKVRETLETYVFTKNYPKVFAIMEDLVRVQHNSELSDIVAECLNVYNLDKDGNREAAVDSIHAINEAYHDPDITGSAAKLFVNLSESIANSIVMSGLKRCAGSVDEEGQFDERQFKHIVEDKEQFRNLVKILRSYNKNDDSKLSSLGSFLFTHHNILEDIRLLSSLLKVFNEFDKNVYSPDMNYALDSMFYRDVTKEQLDDLYDALYEHKRDGYNVVNDYDNLREIVTFFGAITGKFSNDYCISLVKKSVPLADYKNFHNFLEGLSNNLDNIVRITKESSEPFPSKSEPILPGTFASEDVVKLVKSFDLDFQGEGSSLSRTSFRHAMGAITYTSAVCRDQNVVDRLARVMLANKEHDDYLRMVAVLNNNAYNLRNKGNINALMDLFETYQDSPAFSFVTKSLNSRLHKAVMEDGIKLTVPEVDRRVKRLSSPEMKKYFEEIADQSCNKGLVNLIGDCAVSGLDEVGTFVLIDDLSRLFSSPYIENIVKAVNRAFVNEKGRLRKIGNTVEGNIFRDNNDNVIHGNKIYTALANRICNNLSLPSIYETLVENEKTRKNKYILFAVSNAIGYVDNNTFDTFCQIFTEFANLNINTIPDDEFIGNLNREENLDFLGKVMKDKVEREKYKADSSERLEKTVQVISGLLYRVGLSEPAYYDFNVNGKVTLVTAAVTGDEELTYDVLRHYKKLSKDDNEFFADSFSDLLRSTLNKIAEGDKIDKVDDLNALAKIVIEDSIKHKNQYSFDLVGVAVRETAENYYDSEMTQTVADIINRYRGMDGVAEIATEIKDTVRDGLSDKFEHFCKAVMEKDFSDVIELYQGEQKDVVKYVVGLMTELAGWPPEMGELSSMSEFFKRYHGHSNIEQIAKVFHNIVPELESYERFLKFDDVRNFIDNCPDKHNIVANSVKAYLEEIYHGISDTELRNHLPMYTVNNLVKAYTLSCDISSGWSSEAKEDVVEGFFNSMNGKAKLGNNLRDKIQILTEWSTNVSRAIVDNAADLKFAELSEKYLTGGMVAWV